MICQCQPNAGCVKCSFDKIDTEDWCLLVTNRIADELEGLIIQCKHSYYCIGEPEISDYMYDAYETGLKTMRPKSKVLEMVGCPLCHKEK
jgi:hypothetical protein